MLAHRLRRRANIGQTLDRCVVFAGQPSERIYSVCVASLLCMKNVLEVQYMIQNQFSV